MAERMTRGELRTVREWLGLDALDLSRLLGVRHDTVRKWESGGDLIPYGVAGDLETLEAATAAAVDQLVAALRDAPDPAVVVYLSDQDMHAERPDTAHLPARWWRHVVARACEDVPGVEIGTRDELTTLGVTGVTPTPLATPHGVG